MVKEQKKVNKILKLFFGAVLTLLFCISLTFKLSNIKTVSAYETDHSDNGLYSYSPIIPFSDISLYVVARNYEPVGYITPIFTKMSYPSPSVVGLYKIYSNADGLNVDQYFYPANNSFFIYFDCLELIPNNVEYLATWKVSAYNFAMPRTYNELSSNQLCLISFLQLDSTKQKNASGSLSIDYYEPNDDTLYTINSSSMAIWDNGVNIYEYLWYTVPNASYIQRLTLEINTSELSGVNYRFVLNNGLIDSRILSQYNQRDLNYTIVNVDSINWFEQIIRDVNSILSIEILPNISFNDILLIAIAIPLAMWVVKMFVH